MSELRMQDLVPPGWRRVLVQTAADPRELARKVGRFRVLRRYRHWQGMLIAAPEAQVERLRTLPGVTVLEDPRFEALDGRANVAFGVTAARERYPGLDGSGVVVAVLDSGIDAQHPDLQGQVIGWVDFTFGQAWGWAETTAEEFAQGELQGVEAVPGDWAATEGFLQLLDQRDATEPMTVVLDFEDPRDLERWQSTFRVTAIDRAWQRQSDNAYSGRWSMRAEWPEEWPHHDIKLDVELAQEGQLAFALDVRVPENDGVRVALLHDDDYRWIWSSTAEDRVRGWQWIELPLPAGRSTIEIGYSPGATYTSEDVAWVDRITVIGVRRPNHVLEGYRITPPITIPAMTVQHSYVGWTSVEPPGTAIVIEVSLDGGTTWTPCANGGPIPGLEPGVSWPGGQILVRQRLRTNDPTYTPVLHDFLIYAQAATHPYDDNGHGTHVAGIIAGKGVQDPAYAGVAPGAKLVGVKVLDAGGGADGSTILAAMEWVMEHKDEYGIKICNMSLGLSSGWNQWGDSDPFAWTADWMSLVSGILPVIAAGNDGPYPATIATPGSARYALTVGAAMDPANGGYGVAWFSSRGPTGAGVIKPDVCAPGYGIIAPRANTTGYVAMSGTSMATPFAAGVAALVWQARPDLTAMEVRQLLIDTAVPMGEPGHDREYGAGLIDAHRAVAAARGDPLPPPRFRADTVRVRTFEPGDERGYATQLAPGQQALVTAMVYSEYSEPDAGWVLGLQEPSGELADAGWNVYGRQAMIAYIPEQAGDHAVLARQTGGRGEFRIDVAITARWPQVAHEEATRQDFAQGILDGVEAVPGGLRLAPGRTQGSRITPAIDLGAIRRAAMSLVDWDAMVPIGASVRVYVSLDGGASWQEVMQGGPIPGIDWEADLLGRMLLVRQELVANQSGAGPVLRAFVVQVAGLPAE